MPFKGNTKNEIAWSDSPFGFSRSVLSGLIFGGITSFGLSLIIKLLIREMKDTRLVAVGREIAFDGMSVRTGASFFGFDAWTVR